MSRTIHPPAIVLRPEAVDEEALLSYGYATLSEFARACALSGSTMRRVAARQTDPGPRLIAAVMLRTGRRFEDLFEVIDKPVTVAGERAVRAA